MVDTDGAEPASAGTPTGTHTRRLPWWVSGITSVVGLVAGALAVGLLSLTTPDFAVGAGAAAEPPAAGSAPDGPVPVVAEARVNAACLAVINEAQDVYSVLTGLDEAVTDVDLAQLDDMVRRLQPIEARLGRDLQRCEVTTDLATEPSPSAEPEPTPQPSATTTP